MSAFRCEIDLDDDLDYQVASRPMRVSSRPPRATTNRYAKQASPAGARQGIHRRGTRGGLSRGRVVHGSLWKFKPSRGVSKTSRELKTQVEFE